MKEEFDKDKNLINTMHQEKRDLEIQLEREQQAKREQQNEIDRMMALKVNLEEMIQKIR
jgi:hypothetical protein